MLTYLKIIRQLQLGIIEQKKIGNTQMVKELKKLKKKLKKEVKPFKKYLEEYGDSKLTEFLKHYYFQAKPVNTFKTPMDAIPDSYRTSCSRRCKDFDKLSVLDTDKLSVSDT